MLLWGRGRSHSLGEDNALWEGLRSSRHEPSRRDCEGCCGVSLRLLPLQAALAHSPAMRGATVRPSWGQASLKPDAPGPVRTCLQANRHGVRPAGVHRGTSQAHSPRLQDDVLVQGFLPVGQAALQHVLVPLGQLLLHVPLGPPQDERLGHLGKETLWLASGRTSSMALWSQHPRPHVPGAGG